MTETRKRRARDPEATREDILEAASSLLARQGPEACSLSGVAKLAGVNRGTAYQHFETREKLIDATMHWVSDKMFRAVFGDPETIGERQVEEVDTSDLTERLVEFAMESPELCRIWLIQLLQNPEPTSDPFWREYEGSLRRFSETDLAPDGVDSEVMGVLILSGTFLWPVWARSHAKSEEERRKLAKRFTRELLRLSLYGSMRPECFPDIADELAQPIRAGDIVPLAKRR